MGLENPVHLLFIAAVALIVLGPKRLPDLAKALGQGIREFRDSMSEGEDEEAVSSATEPATAQAVAAPTAPAKAQASPPQAVAPPAATAQAGPPTAPDGAND
jgi:sec-independent protein translocase protein TatA